MYFEVDEERTFELDVHKLKDITITFGEGRKQYIAHNNFIGREYIAFFLERSGQQVKDIVSLQQP